MNMKLAHIIFMALSVTCCACNDLNGDKLPIQEPELNGTMVFESCSDGGRTDIYAYDCAAEKTPVNLSSTWKIDSPSRPKISPDGRRIVFHGRLSGQWNVFVYDLTTGKLPVSLTEGQKVDCTQPVFTADGSGIIYIRNGQIAILNLDTGVSENMTYEVSSSFFEPFPSQDIAEVVYSYEVDNRHQIGKLVASTMSSSSIFYSSSSSNKSPVFLADGSIAYSSQTGDTGIYYSSKGSGNSRKTVSGRWNDLFPIEGEWVVAAKDGNVSLVNVVRGHAVPVIINDHEGEISSPSYSAASIAIASPEDGGRTDEPAEGGATDEITSDTERPQLKGKMVYHNYTSYDAMDSRMYIYDFADNSLECISNGWTNVRHPMNGHFSPEGDFITFMGIGDGGTWDVFIYYFGAKQPVNLTLSGDYRDEDPKVSYDGGRIVFKRDDRIAEINLSDKSVKVHSKISGTGHHSMPYYTTDGKSAVCGCGSDGEDYIGLWNFERGTMSVLYDRKGVVEYYPITIDAESFYYSAHVSESNRHDQLYKGFFDGSPAQKLKFNATNADYSDACPVASDWLILCSTRSGSRGGYDLYIANGVSGAIFSLSDYNNSINSSLQELGADYHAK